MQQVPSFIEIYTAPCSGVDSRTQGREHRRTAHKPALISTALVPGRLHGALDLCHPWQQKRRLRTKNGVAGSTGTRASATTGPLALDLDRRTGHITIGAEHAAVAGQGFQQAVARLAFVEPLTGVGGHGFGLGMAAVRAGQGGLQDGAGSHAPIIQEKPAPATKAIPFQRSTPGSPKKRKGTQGAPFHTLTASGFTCRVPPA